MASQRDISDFLQHSEAEELKQVVMVVDDMASFDLDTFLLSLGSWGLKVMEVGLVPEGYWFNCMFTIYGK